MSRDLHSAAGRLQRHIVAPPGAVNTLATSDDHGPIIRVLVDPVHWLNVKNIPDTFEGYRVSVEKRQPSVASRL